ncbi:MAG: hypothetical protein JST86_08270 [Bacteroidetes bacterium]|nr:hypothetical protein [Bacteroidota bacterium]
MKWVSVNNGTAQESFELWRDDKKLAAISFSSNTRVARFVSNLTKRLFFFEKRGLLSPKAVIKNEYGIKMGKLELEKPGAQNGLLEMDDKKYHYTFNDNNDGAFKVYDEHMQEILFTCSFPTFGKANLHNRSFLDTKLPSLLLVSFWFSFQPKQNSTTPLVEFAF